MIEFTRRTILAKSVKAVIRTYRMSLPENKIMVETRKLQIYQIKHEVFRTARIMMPFTSTVEKAAVGHLRVFPSKTYVLFVPTLLTDDYNITTYRFHIIQGLRIIPTLPCRVFLEHGVMIFARSVVFSMFYEINSFSYSQGHKNM